MIESARKGDPQALSRIAEWYFEHLALLARLQIGRKLRGMVDPGDVVQDTFIEVHRQISHFRGSSEAELLSWLRRILAGRIALAWRKYFGGQRRGLALDRELIEGIDRSKPALDRRITAPSSSPSRRASRGEQAVILANALAKLPKHYREVVILRHVEGLPLNEAARKMGRSRDSTQKLWARALLMLRRSIGDR